MYRRYCLGHGGTRSRTDLFLSIGRENKVKDNRSRATSTEPIEKTTSRFGKTEKTSQNNTDDIVTSLLSGDITKDFPSSDKIVRIFLSSTFTDTRHERNSLMEHVYPRLKEWCQGRGYQFQVVDMRWGIRDEATDDHRTTDLCLREIDQCKKLTTGPCFVTFLSHKYGYRCFPRKFEVTEFQQLLEAIPTESVRDLLTKWFKLDENSVPSTYVLQPISSQLPDYKSNEKEARAQAANQWWNEMEAMLEAIGQAAPTCLSPERAHALVQSVTEAEIRQGILSEPSMPGRSLWFYRQIEDIDSQPPDRLASRFKDCKDSEKKNRESHQLLEQLKEEMTSSLPPDHVHRYSVTWDPEAGINPEKNEGHREYLNKLGRDFENHVKRLVKEAILDREQVERVTPLVEEVTQHARFCQGKCRTFCGRQDALERTSEYLRGSSNKVKVVHGPSGCGKTSIMAMAATQACSIHQGKGAVVLRFLGTTAESSTLVSLLASILLQLLAVRAHVTGKTPDPLPNSLSERIDLLHQLLKRLPTEGIPVTLLLDSVDQLDPANGARQLAWLPATLPAKVKVIVSTLPEPEYEALPTLQALYQDDLSNFYDVPTLAETDVSDILDQWLAASQRRLTANQRGLLLDAFRCCPLPLYLKLSFDSACKWRSYLPLETTVLQATVRESIAALLVNLEAMHGATLVSRALGYLTISRNGLSETELEDILSCDDDVLNDVYVYWTPPMRRLPPLLLARLRADLGEYLVERGVDGVGVLFWYHRQFTEAAFDRYCSDVTTRMTLHKALADYFAGTWAEGRAKPYTDKGDTSGQADRIVSPQPLKFGHSNFNLRKLNNLPYHAVKAADKDLAKKECLLNFQFLLNKILACGVRSVLDDFSLARKEFPDDADVTTVAETFQLSQDALQHDPKQLPAQILCRIVDPSSQRLQELLQQCRASDDVYLLPNQPLVEPPGGQLVHCIKERTAEIDYLTMTADGTTVITSSWRDKSVYVFDVTEGRRVRKMDGLSSRPQAVHLCCDDTLLVTVSNINFYAYWLSTGLPAWKVATKATPFGTKTRVCFCGPGRSVMAVVTFEDCDLYCARTGQKTYSIPKPMSVIKRSFALRKSTHRPRADTICLGNDKHVVFTEVGQTSLLVIDIVEHKIVVFHRFNQDDDDDEDDDLTSSDEDDEDDTDRECRRQRLNRLRLRLKERRHETKNDAEEDEKKDEFVVQDMVLSPDGSHVLCAPRDRNELHVLDICTMETVTTIQGTQGDFQQRLHMTSDSKYVISPKHNHVLVCDVASGRLASILTHIENVNDVTTVDMRTFVTVAKDNVIRIWDLTRGLPAGETTALHFRNPFQIAQDGNSVSAAEQVTVQNNGSSMNILKICSLAISGYVMLLTSCEKDHRYLQVYDVSKNEVIKQCDLGPGADFPDSLQHSLCHVEGTLAMMCADGWLKTVDLDSMTVKHVLRGYMRDWVDKSTVLINNRADVLTLTKHRHHLQIFNFSLGKVTKTIKQKGETLQKLTHVVANEGSTVAVSGTDDHRSLLVFDLQQTTHLYSLQASELHQPDLQLDEQITLAPNGRFMVLGGRIIPEGSVPGKTEGIKHEGMLVYDVQQGQLVRYLQDSSARKLGWKYWVVRMLDDDRVLSCCLDTCARVHNIHTGEMLWRMEGKLSSPYPYMEPHCPLLVMKVMHRAKTFSVYTLPQLSLLASFSMDHKLGDFQLLPGVEGHFLAVHPKYPLPVVFTVHGPSRKNQATSAVASCPLFDNKVLSHTLDLHNAEGLVADVTGEDINDEEN